MVYETESPQGYILMHIRDGYTFIALESPQVCHCGRLMFFAINRDGKTCCVACNTSEQHSH